MVIYNIAKGGQNISHVKKWYNLDEQFFVIGNNSEIEQMNRLFHYDPNTVSECVNLDENIRFESFNGYDFISLIYFYHDEINTIFSEINVFIGKNYIFLVLPSDPKINGEFTNYFHNILEQRTAEFLDLTGIYYRIFNKIITNLSYEMETYEDIIYALESKIIEKAAKQQLQDIIRFKSTTAKIKKMMRPMLYIGDQFVVNENQFIPKNKLKYFKNIDIRMNKIYDFANSLSEAAEQLLITYDSKINMQTNETVTKLTVIAVCIAPLTVITGIYGMNFDFMPELHMKYAYPVIIAVMIFIVISIYLYFKRNKFL